MSNAAYYGTLAGVADALEDDSDLLLDDGEFDEDYLPSGSSVVEPDNRDIALEARLRTTPGHPARTPEEIEAITEEYYRQEMEGLGL